MAQQRREEEERKLRELKGEVEPKNRRATSMVAGASFSQKPNQTQRHRQKMPTITEHYLQAMNEVFENVPELKLIKKCEIQPDEQNGITFSKIKGYVQMPNPLIGSGYHINQMQTRDIKKVITQRDKAESTLKAYLETVRARNEVRGVITHMRRESDPQAILNFR